MYTYVVLHTFQYSFSNHNTQPDWSSVDFLNFYCYELFSNSGWQLTLIESLQTLPTFLRWSVRRHLLACAATSSYQEWAWKGFCNVCRKQHRLRRYLVLREPEWPLTHQGGCIRDSMPLRRTSLIQVRPAGTEVISAAVSLPTILLCGLTTPYICSLSHPYLSLIA